MDREFEIEIFQTTAEAHRISQTAMLDLAKANVPPYAAVLTMLVHGVVRPSEKLPVEEMIEVMGLMEMWLDEVCDRLENLGFEVDRWDRSKRTKSG
jgi:hypothetical protein